MTTNSSQITSTPFQRILGLIKKNLDKGIDDGDDSIQGRQISFVKGFLERGNIKRQIQIMVEKLRDEYDVENEAGEIAEQIARQLNFQIQGESDDSVISFPNRFKKERITSEHGSIQNITSYASCVDKILGDRNILIESYCPLTREEADIWIKEYETICKVKIDDSETMIDTWLENRDNFDESCRNFAFLFDEASLIQETFRFPESKEHSKFKSAVYLLLCGEFPRAGVDVEIDYTSHTSHFDKSFFSPIIKIEVTDLETTPEKIADTYRKYQIECGITCSKGRRIDLETEELAMAELEAEAVMQHVYRTKEFREARIAKRPTKFPQQLSDLSKQKLAARSIARNKLRSKFLQFRTSNCDESREFKDKALKKLKRIEKAYKQQVKAILENSVIPNLETQRKSIDLDFSSRIERRRALVSEDKNLPESQRAHNVQKLELLLELHNEELEKIANATLWLEPCLFERFREPEDTGIKSKGLKIIPKRAKSKEP